MKPLRPNSVPAGYKQTEVGVIPRDWCVVPLGNHVQITSGESPSVFRFTPDGIPYFKVEQLNNSEKHLCSSSTPYHFEKGKTVARGSVVFAKRGAAIALNKVRVLAQESFMDTNLMALSPTEGLDSEFLFYRLRYLGLWKFADTTSVPQINNKHVKPLLFPLPRMPEQRAIADALSDVDGLLGGLDRLIAKKRDLKQAAMQQLLTGQTRLPGFHGQWEPKQLRHGGRCFRGVSYQGESDLFTHDTNETKRLLRANNVQDAVIFTNEVQFVNGARVSPHQILRPNDILICMANGSKALVGKAGLFAVNDGHEYTFGAFMGCFRTDATAADPRFVFFLLQTSRYRDYINNLLAGSSINNLRPSSIESLEFSFPKAPEQTAIAEALSDMDAELAALEQRREKTHALKQAMMQELLTGRIRLVANSSEPTVLPFVDSAPPAQLAPEKPAHSWAFNEAVVIAVLAAEFGTAQFPLGRMRYTKLAYLLHRHAEHVAKGYLKKAAGPYNPATRYAGPEKIACENGYIKRHKRDQFEGFIAAEKSAQARAYFLEFYGLAALDWLQQFRFWKKEELERVATVDMAMEELRRADREATIDTVKEVIASSPDWLPKLDRAEFGDAHLDAAIKQCRALFPIC